jgi:hypothetical protein
MIFFERYQAFDLWGYLTNDNNLTEKNEIYPAQPGKPIYHRKKFFLPR